MKSRPTPEEWSHRATVAVTRHRWHRIEHHPFRTLAVNAYFVSIVALIIFHGLTVPSVPVIILSLLYELPGCEYVAIANFKKPQSGLFADQELKNEDTRDFNKHPFTFHKFLHFVKRHWIAHAIGYYVFLMVILILLSQSKGLVW